MIRVFSAGIRRIPHWEAFLEKEQTQFDCGSIGMYGRTGKG